VTSAPSRSTRSSRLMRAAANWRRWRRDCWFRVEDISEEKRGGSPKDAVSELRKGNAGFIVRQPYLVRRCFFQFPPSTVLSLCSGRTDAGVDNSHTSCTTNHTPSDHQIKSIATSGGTRPISLASTEMAPLLLSSPSAGRSRPTPSRLRSPPMDSPEIRIICLLTASVRGKRVGDGVLLFQLKQRAMQPLELEPSPNPTCHVKTCIVMRHFPVDICYATHPLDQSGLF
jgi:hypothetical protein